MLQKNKCMKCGKPATNKITRIENGQVMDIFLCAEHAGEASPFLKKIPLSNILEGLLKQEWSSGPPEMPAPGKPGLRCARCGLTFEAYKKNLMLGCSECYASFRDELLIDLRKFHGDTRHVGRRPGGGEMAPVVPKVPASLLASEAAGAIEPEEEPPLAELQDPAQSIEDLTSAMQEAIAAEDYARAAIYRDQIRDIKKKLK